MSSHAHVHFEDTDVTSNPFGINSAQDETTEVNTGHYPNYQSNLHTQSTDANSGMQNEQKSNQWHDEIIDDDEEDLTKLEGKKVGNFAQFIYKNSEQFKSISGGLIILLATGVQFVWALYRIFNYHNGEREHPLQEKFIIWSWYIGAIVGSCFSGFIIPKVVKKKIYIHTAALLIISGFIILFAGEKLILLSVSRLLGGIAHGVTYVTVLIHATENAADDFRELLATIVGFSMNLSIIFSIICLFPFETHLNESVFFGMFCSAICSYVILSKHYTETVHFLLKHNGSELEVLHVLAKLRKKSSSAKSVQREYLTIRQECSDETELIGDPGFTKILFSNNIRPLVVCIYGRLCSVISFNLPMIVMMMLFLRSWTITPSNQLSETTVGPNLTTTPAAFTSTTPLTTTQLTTTTTEMTTTSTEKVTTTTTTTTAATTTVATTTTTEKSSAGGPLSSDKIEKPSDRNSQKTRKKRKSDAPNSQQKGKTKSNQEAKTATTTTTAKPSSNSNNTANSTTTSIEEGANIFSWLYKHELSAVLIFWFIFGTIAAFVSYMLNFRRKIYRFIMIKSIILLVLGIAHAWLDNPKLETIMHIFLFMYFTYLTMPIDANGHCMLSEAFPMTLQPYSVGFVVSIEHLMHIIIISLYMNPSFQDRIVIFMILVALMSYELSRSLPDKYNLSSQMLRVEYQRANLMFFKTRENIHGQIGAESLY